MRRFLLVVLIAFGFLQTHSFADQIVMSNGDRLGGLIIKSDGKKLAIKTEFAGDVSVQWTAITEINSTNALHVAVRDGQGARGGVEDHARQSRSRNPRTRSGCDLERCHIFFA